MPGNKNSSNRYTINVYNKKGSQYNIFGLNERRRLHFLKIIGIPSSY